MPRRRSLYAAPEFIMEAYDMWYDKKWLQDASAARVDFRTLDILMDTTADVIHDTNAIINEMEGIRLRHRNTPEYECGYLNKVLEEYFRKQVNIYNTSKYMNTRLYTEELVLYLEEIEHHYWQIEHVGQMLHEIERKHKIGEEQNEYDVTRDHSFTAPETVTIPAKFTSRTKWHFWKYLKHKMEGVKETKPTIWPKEYGWEVAYEWK